MPNDWIDIWNPSTFDFELRDFLRLNIDVARRYKAEEIAIQKRRDKMRIKSCYEENIHEYSYGVFMKKLDAEIKMRRLRAWHHTRLTDRELKNIIEHGFSLSNLQGLRKRLDHAVEDGHLTLVQADYYFLNSPFQNDDMGGRTNLFWLTSQPYPPDHSDVELLLRHWGGESVYFNHENGHLSDLSSIGSPYIFEVVVDADKSMDFGCLEKSIVSVFLSEDNKETSRTACGICMLSPIPSGDILRIHGADQSSYLNIGRGYPPSFTK